MQRVALTWTDIFGVTGIEASFQPLYLPGFMFLVTIAITYLLHRMNFQQIKASWQVAGKQIIGAGFALLLALPMVRVFHQLQRRLQLFGPRKHAGYAG